MKGIVVRALGIGVVLSVTAISLTAGEAPKAKNAGTPLITDWTQQHVIFSQPRTPEQAAALQNDVRYQQQLARHVTSPKISKKVDPESLRRYRQMRRRLGRRMHRDWSWDMGPGATVGEARYPAKYSFSSTTATCGLNAQPDFVVYTTSKAGSASQGSILALTNLYGPCGGPVPANFWSYNTGGQILTSPVLSLDGTQVAFAQTSGGAASLVILKYLKFDGNVQTPTSLTPLPPSSYFGCTAPCMTTLPLGADDTNSSVYYDYGSDTAFVGDDSGKLHQFTGVFQGTPTEVTAGWPVTVSGNVLTSAVHDASSGNTFVGDSGGFLYRIDAGGLVTASGRLDFGTGLTQGPIVDAGIGAIYAFSSKDAGGTAAAVFQLPTSFGAGAPGSETTVGAATAGTVPLYNGGFNHEYIFSSNSTGSLFVCGNPGGNPTLYRVPISAGTMGTASPGPVLAGTSGAKCSPVTDVYNANLQGQGLPREWVFLSYQAASQPIGCNNHSCIMNFKVTPWEPNTVYNIGQEILDSNWNIQVAENSGATSGASAPAWGTLPFSPTNDNGVHWRNQGPLLSNPPNPNWAPNTTYSGAFEVIDGLNNIEIALVPGGQSGATPPAWNTVEGGTTNDGTQTWYNLGANPVAGLEEPGGASGIIIDNTANLNGASQVYFSTLQDNGCTGNNLGAGSGTGGCAVQASQQALQ
jgi:hypothetical protein